MLIRPILSAHAPILFSFETHIAQAVFIWYSRFFEATSILQHRRFYKISNRCSSYLSLRMRIQLQFPRRISRKLSTPLSWNFDSKKGLTFRLSSEIKSRIVAYSHAFLFSVIYMLYLQTFHHEMKILLAEYVKYTTVGRIY